MAMVRVPPGTIPREEPRDRLRELYARQHAEEVMRRWEKQREDLNSAMSGRTGEFARPLTGPLQQQDPEEIAGKENWKAQNISSKDLPDFTGTRPSGFWGRNAAWNQLTPTQKAAAMALLEADSSGGKPNFNDAKNAMGAMINLGEHVSRKIYQPTIEPAQYARLQTVTRSPEFQALTGLAEAREAGQVGDWVGGATHFLAKPEVMLKLEAQDPQKYRSWRGWTGYDPETGQYANQVLSDSSHVFLAPEGKHSAGQPLVGPSPTAMPDSEIGPPSQPEPLPTATSPMESGQPSPLPKLSELFGLTSPKTPSPAPNQLADLQSKPITIAGLEPSPDQEAGAFALLPSQRMRAPAPGQPTLPVPRKPPGFG
jgi:hypothetical protein